MNTIEIVHNATSVKNAVLVHNTEDKTYHLIHYDTEILSFSENKEIFLALQCSQSSTRAINQVVKFFNLQPPKLLDRSEISKR